MGSQGVIPVLTLYYCSKNVGCPKLVSADLGSENAKIDNHFSNEMGETGLLVQVSDNMVDQSTITYVLCNYYTLHSNYFNQSF